MIRRTSLAAALLAAAFSPAYAQQGTPVQAQPVQAQDVWARATPPHASTGAVYMTLTSPADDALTGASTPVAQKAGVHEMHMDGTIMRMRPVEGGLDLPAGKPVALAPGGYHLMLEGLKGPLKPGQSVPVHLTFRNAPPLDVAAEVRGMNATGQPNQAAMPGMAMGH